MIKKKKVTNRGQGFGVTVKVKKKINNKNYY